MVLGEILCHHLLSYTRCLVSPVYYSVVVVVFLDSLIRIAIEDQSKGNHLMVKVRKLIVFLISA